MSSLTSPAIKIKVQGAYKGKFTIQSTTTIGDIKNLILAELKEKTINLKLFIKGKTFEGSESDSILAADVGVKNKCLIKAIIGTSTAVQQKTASLSSVPGAKPDEPGPRQRCKGGCGFWADAVNDWYCSSCSAARSGKEQPPHWEYNDGGWTKFPKQISVKLEAARKIKKTNIMSYGSSGHPQKIDLRNLTMTPTRGPRQGRAQQLRRVPPTHPGTFLTAKEYAEQQTKEEEKKKTDDLVAQAEAIKEEKLKKLNCMTQCCKVGCKKKLKLSDTPCRCELRFCLKHRLPENHDCKFDYKKRANENLADRLGDGGGAFDQLRTQSRDRI
jgi:predicted nucleic acid binding AN1-type Zn finger protein